MAELVVVKGRHRGVHLKLGEQPVIIGRTTKAHLPLPEDSKVSTQHARVTPMQGERYILEDLDSTNGTFVNDERVEQMPLRSGDLVRIGRSLLIFRLGESSVHLSDVALLGGGSSSDIKVEGRDDDDDADDDDLRASAERPPLGAAGGDALEALTLAGVAPDLPTGLERVASTLLDGCHALRAYVFLRHPLTGGLGRAAQRSREGVREGPVDASTLGRAVRGDVVVTSATAAAPIPGAANEPLGAVYVDGLKETGDTARLLTAAGVIASLLVANDRSRRLADAAIEVVALAQERVARQPVDLRGVLQAVDREHAPVARRRGIEWHVTYPERAYGLADPVMLSRGLDRVLEHLLTVARGDVRLAVVAAGDGRLRLEVSRPRIEPPEAVARLADPEGVVSDLRRARDALGDAGLAVGRVTLLRAGARLSVALSRDDRVVYVLEVEPAR